MCPNLSNTSTKIFPENKLLATVSLRSKKKIWEMFKESSQLALVR